MNLLNEFLFEGDLDAGDHVQFHDTKFNTVVRNTDINKKVGIVVCLNTLVVSVLLDAPLQSITVEWTCKGPYCPARKPVPKNLAPTCYTCGRRMENV